MAIRRETFGIPFRELPASGQRATQDQPEGVFWTESSDGYVRVSKKHSGTRGSAICVIPDLPEQIAKAHGKSLAGGLIDWLEERNVQRAELRYWKESTHEQKALSGTTLLFIHGTYSNTEVCFGGLPDANANTYAALARRYDRVLAFDHRTLSESPETNALELLREIERLNLELKESSLDIVCHSRGGIVTDLLALAQDRGCLLREGASDGDRALLDRWREQRPIRRIARVATPASGTTLADHRELSAWLEYGLNALRALARACGANEALSLAIDYVATLLVTTVHYGLEPAHAPGLEAMHKESRLMRAMAKAPPISQETLFWGTSLEGNWSSFGGVLAKAAKRATWSLHGEANDVVVPTQSMRGGVPRTKAIDRTGPAARTWHCNYFHEHALAQSLRTFFSAESVPALPDQSQRGKPRSSHFGTKVTVSVRLPRGAEARDGWPFLHALSELSEDGHKQNTEGLLEDLIAPLQALIEVKLEVAAGESADTHLTLEADGSDSGEGVQLILRSPIPIESRRASLDQALKKALGDQGEFQDVLERVIPERDTDASPSGEADFVGALLRRDPKELARLARAIEGWARTGVWSEPRTGGEAYTPSLAPSTYDLIALACGATARPRGDLQVGAVHGSVGATETGAVLLPYFSDERLPFGTEQLGWPDEWREQVERVCPPEDGVFFIREPESGHRAVALLGLPPAHRVSARDVQSAVAQGIDALRMGQGAFGTVAMPAFGDVRDGFGLSRSAMVRAAIRGAEGSNVVRSFLLTERYEDRAISTQQAIHQLATSADFRELRLRRRSGYFGAAAAPPRNEGPLIRWRIDKTERGLRFSADHGGPLERTIDKELPHTEESVDTRVLMPGELWSNVRHGSTLYLSLDEESAVYPWEQTSEGTRHLGLEGPILRRLRDVPRVFGLRTPTSPEASIVANPDGSLQGAAVEGQNVGKLLKERQFTVHAGLNPDVQILHLAAHGYAADGGGVLLGNGQELRVATIQSWTSTPALVFLNCCQAGSVRAERLIPQLATAFMKRGTRAFIGAAWNIDDELARRFAERFYERFLAGMPLGEATFEARRHVHALDPGSSTWAAYQVYGDGAWVLRTASRRRAHYVSGTEVLADTVTLHGRLQKDDHPNGAARTHAAIAEEARRLVDVLKEGNLSHHTGPAYVRLALLLLDLDLEDEAKVLLEGAIKKRDARIESVELYWDLRSRMAFEKGTGLKELRTCVTRLKQLTAIRPAPRAFDFLALAHARSEALRGVREDDTPIDLKHVSAAFSAAEGALDGKPPSNEMRLRRALLLGQHVELDPPQRQDKAKHVLPQHLHALTLAENPAIAAEILDDLDALFARRASRLARRTTVDLLSLCTHFNDVDGRAWWWTEDVMKTVEDWCAVNAR